VHTILAGSQYREQAQRLQKNFSRYDALTEIARSVNTLIANTEDSRMTDAPHPIV
jgi:UDP:flavonoid glycosyltransferase YjiC (YdhE family)